MANVEAIIFDLGGVILDIDISKTNEAFRRLGFKRIDEYFGLGHAGNFFRDYEDGTIGDEEFVEKVRQTVGDHISREEVIGAWNALLGEFPSERIQYLEGLKEHYRLFLFSNTNGIHLEAFSKIFESSFTGRNLDELFEKTYYSHIEGFRKPDPKGFHHIVKENSLSPGRTVFVDDALVNVEAARKAGLRGLHLEPGKKIEQLDLDFWNSGSI